MSKHHPCNHCYRYVHVCGKIWLNKNVSPNHPSVRNLPNTTQKHRAPLFLSSALHINKLIQRMKPLVERGHVMQMYTTTLPGKKRRPNFRSYLTTNSIGEQLQRRALDTVKLIICSYFVWTLLVTKRPYFRLLPTTFSVVLWLPMIS